jgi:CheY-like chemotaxis protein
MSSPGVILVAEDNEVDVLLLRRAFAKACLPNPLKVVSDGQEAIWYLSGKGKYADRAEYPLPELVLLDIKMPHKNGLEVLKWVREQPSLKPVRVVMLTSSDQARDVDMAYQLGANSFIVKPADFDDLVQLSAALKGGWFDLELPEYRAGQSATIGHEAQNLRG